MGQLLLSDVGAILAQIFWFAIDGANGIIAGLLGLVCSIQPNGELLAAKPIQGGSAGSLQALGEQASSANSELPMHEILGFAFRVYDALKPACYTILAVVIAIAFIKEIQKPDRHVGSVPYIERFTWLWIKFAILKVLIDHAMDITAAIFNLFMFLVGRVDWTASAAGMPSATEIQLALDRACLPGYDGALTLNAAGEYVPDFGSAWIQANSGIGTLLLFLILMLFILAATGLLYLTIFASVWARWMQVFLYLPISPLAMAFAGLDETRSVTRSYLMSICGLGLSFVITEVMIASLPTVLSGVVTSACQGGSVPIVGLVMVLAVLVMYSFSLGKCGQWAHDIIGG